MILVNEDGKKMSTAEIDYDKGYLDIIEVDEQGEQHVVYRKYNKNQIKINEYRKQIENLKRQLSQSDYEAIKYAEGWFTEEEYKPIKEKRENIRKEIRALEDKITNDYQGEIY